MDWTFEAVPAPSAPPSAPLTPGYYKIKTTAQSQGAMPAGWGLSAWHAHGAVRNSVSSKVAVHAGDRWPMNWNVVPGNKPGTYRILTTYHADGHQPAGWGLSCWMAHGMKRNSQSCWVAVHAGDYWPMDWTITDGEKPNTYRVLTTHQPQGLTPAGLGLAAWHAHGAVRNSASSWAAAHSGT